ncbi:MAG: aminoacyl-tRNA hydrolase [Leptospirales bacterium]|nr:aminoacyl-tRNA hydrolase [Leptospirales bacterium]
MKILSFLGNPGLKYAKTRHNIGFLVGKRFAEINNIKINKKSFLSETGLGKVDDIDLLLLFPQTYMNESGKAVKKAMDYYGEKHTNLIVVHDELELKFGEIKEKFTGGHKGHNGLRSIIAETGSADFHRIRFGIGRPENESMSISDHVLSKFTDEEMIEVENLMPGVVEIICNLIRR